MLISRISTLSGNFNEMEIDVTSEQLAQWNSGALIQDVMPHLTPDEREFIMTGVTSSEWDILEELAENHA